LGQIAAKMTIKHYTSCWGVLLLPVLCLAADYGGEWGNSLYLTQDRIDTVRPLISGYENLNLHATKINGSDVSLFANMNLTNGFTDSTRKKFELDHCYLDWRNIGGHVNAKIGRQSIYEGFTIKHIDGIKCDAELGKNFALSGYGGATVPSRYSTEYFQHSPDTAYGLGGIKAAFSTVNTKAAVTFEQDVDYGQIDHTGCGLDFEQSMGKSASLRAMGVYSLTEKDLDDYQLLLTFNPTEKINVEASLYSNTEEPDTADIFKVNVFKNYHQASATATWYCCDKATLSGGYVLRLLDGDNTNHEVEIHYDHTWYSAGFVQDVGYGGSNSEIDAGLRLFTQHQFQFEAGGSGMIYTTKLISNSQLAYVGRAAVVFCPVFSWFNARLELQQLHNQFYASDTRVMLTTQIRFSKFTAQ
jgi:hypothetical protein